jgi:hypothetical protein
MTNDDFPAGVSPEVARAAAEPLDETDLALLIEVAATLDVADPVPDDLVARISFSLALDEVYAEVAAITRVPDDALAVRSDPTAGMRTETLTFAAERLTAMVTVTRTGSDEVRLDGWIAPAAAVRVLLRMQEGTQEVDSDDAGRFVVEGVPEGFAQLTFVPVGDEAGTVVTPLFQL